MTSLILTPVVAHYVACAIKHSQFVGIDINARGCTVLASVPRRFRFRGVYTGVGGEKRLGALVLRLTSEVGAHNKIQSDRTNHRSPTGEIGGFDWTYGNWLS